MSTLKAEVIGVLNQAEVWTANGHLIRLEDMERSHKINVIAWLERQAHWLLACHIREQCAYLAQIEPVMGEMAFDSVESSTILQLEDALTDPLTWLRSTVLMSQLVFDVGTTPDPADDVRAEPF